MRKIFGVLGALVLIGLAVFWSITRPHLLSDDDVAGFAPDLMRGKYVFTAAGCASCHAAPGAEGEAMLVLAGGKAFPSPFGTFHAPNISPSPEGVGGWSVADLANALHEGVGKGGMHLFPALPYTSYRRMDLGDIAALRAYLQTLPPSDAASLPHDVPFPFNIRRLIGGWKLLFLKDGFVRTEVPADAEAGRYIVEALAHCGECHTPRNALGGLDLSRWLGGAPSPDGKGKIPNITPGALTWSESEIVDYLKTGFTPEFDSAGGLMAEVIENMAQLPDEDLMSIAKYLKSLPPVEK